MLPEGPPWIYSHGAHERERVCQNKDVLISKLNQSKVHSLASEFMTLVEQPFAYA